MVTEREKDGRGRDSERERMGRERSTPEDVG